MPQCSYGPLNRPSNTVFKLKLGLRNIPYHRRTYQRKQRPPQIDLNGYRKPADFCSFATIHRTCALASFLFLRSKPHTPNFIARWRTFTQRLRIGISRSDGRLMDMSKTFQAPLTPIKKGNASTVQVTWCRQKCASFLHMHYIRKRHLPKTRSSVLVTCQRHF